MIQNFLDSIGWVSTLLILGGYYFNSVEKRRAAFISWIVGDIGWVVYDLFISNWSHMTLSFIIIFLNLYGMHIGDYFKKDSLNKKMTDTGEMLEG